MVYGRVLAKFKYWRVGKVSSNPIQAWVNLMCGSRYSRLARRCFWESLSPEIHTFNQGQPWYRYLVFCVEQDHEDTYSYDD